MRSRGASRTAVLVCQGRAVAHGRDGAGRFADPTALTMLRDDERAQVAGARRDDPPQGWGDRVEYEMLRANAEVMVPRTVAIDDAVRARANHQLVILGAGLDGRAWRMPELAGVDTFEVDHPSSQADKVARAEGLGAPVATLHVVPVDFSRDDLGEALDVAGHRPAGPTTWVWEGVVTYLTRSEVEATTAVIGARSAPGSRVIVNYQAPSRAAALGLVAARAIALAGRRPSPMADEPRRSWWSADEMASLLRDQGFRVVSDDDLLTLARRLGSRTDHPRSLRAGRVAVADRAGA